MSMDISELRAELRRREREEHVPAHFNENGFLVIDLRDPARAAKELAELLKASGKWK